MIDKLADALIELINSKPRSPTKAEIVEVLTPYWHPLLLVEAGQLKGPFEPPKPGDLQVIAGADCGNAGFTTLLLDNGNTDSCTIVDDFSVVTYTHCTQGQLEDASAHILKLETDEATALAALDQLRAEMKKASVTGLELLKKR